MSRIKLLGYDKLGDSGKDGIRYAWNFKDSNFILESAAFANKTKGSVGDVSGYTTSVGLGCILKHFSCACRFCRTGKMLPFVNLLSAEEIAKQNILMVLTDINCSEKVGSVNNKREFAYMGQGEPGYSYSQLRLAIKITDYVMKKLGQTVYRHIISTAGVIEFLNSVKADIESKYFTSRITMHFSLHSVNNRSRLMPINVLYPYNLVIEALKKISEVSGEKICLGIMLFNSFKAKGCDLEYSTTLKDIEEIFSISSPENFRFSLCEYNSSHDVGESKEFSEKDAYIICDNIEKRGYEVKLFSSFGQKENTACGMLAGKMPTHKVALKWIDLERYADELILEALSQF